MNGARTALYWPKAGLRRFPAFVRYRSHREMKKAAPAGTGTASGKGRE